MSSEQDLINKLLISKKIMEKHNTIGRTNNSLPNNPVLENYEAPKATYNLPEEFISESQIPKKFVNNNLTSEERILKSNLPDEIKQLMLEHPIQQPTNPMSSSETALSDDLIEKATRLMNSNAKGEIINDNVRPKTNQTNNSSLNENQLRKIVRETVESVLHENGLLTESESKSNEIFKFKVGQHIFEGRVLKIKKIKPQ